MDELEQLYQQKAEIDGKIKAALAKEVEGLKRMMAEGATKLREAGALPKDLEDLFTDKAGTFNPYRTLRVSKG